MNQEGVETLLARDYLVVDRYELQDPILSHPLLRGRFVLDN